MKVGLRNRTKILIGFGVLVLGGGLLFRFLPTQRNLQMKRYRDALSRATEDSPEKILALQELGEAGDGEAEVYAVRSFKESDPLKRRSAARVLRYFDSAKAIEILKSLADDADPIVRRVALESLGWQKTYQREKALLDIEKGPTKREGLEAVLLWVGILKVASNPENEGKALGQVKRLIEETPFGTNAFLSLRQEWKDRDALIKYCETLLGNPNLKDKRLPSVARATLENLRKSGAKAVQ